MFTYVYQYDDVKSSGIYFVQGILVIAAVVVAGLVSKKTEKKTVMAGGLILYMMAYLIVMLFPISDVTMYVSIVVYALGNSAYWTMIYAMSYDTAIIEQIKTGDKPDGLYTSLIGLFMEVRKLSRLAHSRNRTPDNRIFYGSHGSERRNHKAQ